MVRIRVLGGGRRVGKSAILIEGSKQRILLDYGVDISGPEPEFPLHVRPRELDAVVITHAHLDHSGAAPLLYTSTRPKLYATRATLDLTAVLVVDFMKLSKYYIPYELPQLEEMLRSATRVEPGAEIEERGIYLKFWDAGHIPGSVMVTVEVDNKTIFYTGDFNLVDTCLLKGAGVEPFSQADVVIMEGTYASYDHPPRAEVERLFVNDLLEVLDNGGKVLVPTFAVGRSQEILCVLEKYNVRYPVYIDGMSRRVNAILLDNLNCLRDPQLFQRALKGAIHVTGWEDRRRALEGPAVIISPAGMLKGGASVYYAKNLFDDPHNGIFFVSYVIPDTPARKLLETGVLQLEDLRRPVAARVEWYDFSSHCGRRELISVVERLDNDTKLVLVHSNEKVGKSFVSYVSQQYGIKALFPAEGETVEL